jgi:oxygen-independent coproporphyrinogen-3 oxidase
MLVGGGTPTDLAPAQLRRFLQMIEARCDLSACKQISYDVDVSTLLGAEGRERLALLRAHGVTRLTVGAQSFDDVLLRKMNRSHDTRDVGAAVSQARAAGFDDVGLDLIYGYLAQDAASWAQTLEAALDVAPEEIQIYRLKLVSWGRGESVLTRQGAPAQRPTEDEALLQKQYAGLRLARAGYREGLTRAFARAPGHTSHYTRDMCCDLRPTAGFGLTASSSYADRFVQNTDRFAEYYALLDAGRLPVAKARLRSSDDQIRWALVVPLKNWQVEPGPYAALAGKPLAEVFRPKRRKLAALGLLDEADGRLRLTDRGRFFADQVCQEFYHPDHKPFPPGDFSHGRLDPYADVTP